MPIDRIHAAEKMPVASDDGDTLVVPLLKKVLVAAKHWRLMEEARVMQHRPESHGSQTVVLRAETIAVKLFNDGKPERSGRPR